MWSYIHAKYIIIFPIVKNTSVVSNWGDTYFKVSLIKSPPGVLYYLKRKFSRCQVVLGRMSSIFFIDYSGPFLNKIGIRRLEFDGLNLINLIKADKSRSIIAFSYYYPYQMFYASRYCPVAGIFHNKSRNHGIIKCFKECLKIGELKTKNPFLAKTAILRGNAQFVRKRFNPNEPKEAPVNIDRLVFQPRPPV